MKETPEHIPLPQDFINRVKSDSFLGESLLVALDTVAPTTIRLNPSKTAPTFENAQPIPWSPNGLLLAERPVFTLDPLFHAGTYYPQEAGSQLLASVLPQLDLPEEPLVLDLCAAPGGKSTLIASFLNEKGLLVCNEIIPNRAKILKENLTKWGASNTIVTNNSPADFQQVPDFFDLMLIDAPCSGEGMFRKDPAARNEWSTASVANCAVRQEQIILDCWDSLKEGGYLIYSTCTFNTSENENMVRWMNKILGAEIQQIELPWAQADRNETGWYALPGKMDTEGYFISVLRKTSESKSSRKKVVKNMNLQIIQNKESWMNWVNSENHTFIKWTNYAFAVPTNFLESYFILHQLFRVIHLGTEIGEITQKGLIPHTALALQPSLLSNDLPRIELTHMEALKYLHGDTFNCAGVHGYHVMTHQNEPLGWVKHLGNRFNNIYPKEWRIRMRVE